MSLIFSSGGGRLGNQILNLIHLTALSLEYNIDVLKINDPFLISLDGSLMYKLEKNNINWEIRKNSDEKFLSKLLLKFLIRLIHFYYFLSPYKKSYKIGSKNNYPKFIIGKKLTINFSIQKLIDQSRKYNVVISGWGLRDWQLVLKHKRSITKNLFSGFDHLLNSKDLYLNDYLLVHIRRSDFLGIVEFDSLNFSNEIWIKSILKICLIKGIKKVVIFSDSLIDEFLLSSLETKGLNVLTPETKYNNHNFLDLFFSYINNCSFILCNASTLVLSIAYLTHEKIFVPSKKYFYKEILLNEAHLSYPTLLNWN